MAEYMACIVERRVFPGRTIRWLRQHGKWYTGSLSPVEVVDCRVTGIYRGITEIVVRLTTYRPPGVTFTGKVSTAVIQTWSIFV
jgi:hypothetical protein